MKYGQSNLVFFTVWKSNIKFIALSVSLWIIKSAYHIKNANTKIIENVYHRNQNSRSQELREFSLLKQQQQQQKHTLQL